MNFSQPDHTFTLGAGISTSNLVLRSALWELEVHTFTRQSLVHLAIGIEPVVDTASLLLIEDALEDLATVLTRASALADDLNRVDEISEDGIVDCCECAGSRTLLSLRCAAAVAALWAWQDAAGGDDQDVAVGELLLELAGEAISPSVLSKKRRVK